MLKILWDALLEEASLERSGRRYHDVEIGRHSGLVDLAMGAFTYIDYDSINQQYINHIVRGCFELFEEGHGWLFPSGEKFVKIWNKKKRRNEWVLIQSNGARQTYY